jgi:hypothetical protein
MGFSKLKYTKDWRNEEDFPAVETDETQVRADQQLLFEEVKEHVNKVADELDAEKQRVDKTMATKEEMRQVSITGVTNGSVTPEKLSPETLDRSYTKAETWTAETKAEYGMEAGAVPDAALAALAPLLHNWWAKKKETAPRRTVVLEGSNVALGNFQTTGRVTFYYADSYVFNAETGEFRLLSPSAKETYATTLKSFAGKYISETDGATNRLILCTESSKLESVETQSSPTRKTFYVDACKVVVSVQRATQLEFVRAKRGTVPDGPGEYVEVGGLVDTAIGLPRMAWGRPLKVYENYAKSTAAGDDLFSHVVLDVGFNPLCLWLSSGRTIVPEIEFAGRDYYHDGIIDLPNSDYAGGYYFAIGL